MTRSIITALLCAAVLLALVFVTDASAQQAYNRQWGRSYNTQDWNRFYHYPYVWYPQNFWGTEYYRSSDDMYYRYPPEMQIPVYNKKWHSEYPQRQKYHDGAQFIMDVF